MFIMFYVRTQKFMCEFFLQMKCPRTHFDSATPNGNGILNDFYVLMSLNLCGCAQAYLIYFKNEI